MLFGEQEYLFDGENVVFNPEHNCSDSNEFPSILDATISYAEDEVNWYNQEVRKGNIIDSIAVYVLDEGKGEYNNCSLVKYGHYDILIDCGSTDESSVEFIKKLKSLVTDGKIEYLIVTHYQISNISQLVGTYENHCFYSDGVLDQFEIGKIIDGKNTNFKEEETVYYKEYIQKVAGLNRVSLNRNESEWNRIEDSSGLLLNVWGNRLPPDQEDENNYSLVTLIRFYDKKILFVGDLVNYTGILSKYNNELSNIDFFRLSHSFVSCENMQGFGDFLSVTNPKYIAIGSPLGYNRYSSCFYDESSLENLNRFINIYSSNCKVFFCGSIGAFGGYEPDNGDLKFFISKSSNRPRKKDIEVYGKNGNKDLKSIEDKYR